MTNLMLITLVGGVILLLYGMRLVGEGLQLAAGGRMRHVLGSITRNPLKGAMAGAFVAAVIQSSTATTVMLVGFASSGLLSLTQAIGVILGADIGTTLTVQLIAFQIFDYALLLVIVGYVLIFTTKRKIFKYVGQAVLGFGFIFFSVKVMSDAMAPLRQSDIVKALLLSLGEQPLLGVVVAAVLSALVASSAATIGLAITLSLPGLLPLHAAIPIIFGANIGTCATALASSVGSHTEAKRVATAHIFFKVVGVLIFLPFIRPLARLVELTAADVPRQIANAHTLFNVGITALFLPFSSILAHVITRLVPETKAGEGLFKPKYLDDRMLETPALALGQAAREALRMADIVSDMFGRTIGALSTDDPEFIEFVEEKDDQVDILDREIKHYLRQPRPGPGPAGPGAQTGDQPDRAEIAPGAYPATHRGLQGGHRHQRDPPGRAHQPEADQFSYHRGGLPDPRGCLMPHPADGPGGVVSYHRGGLSHSRECLILQ